MSARPTKGLSDEDRVLWNLVARSAKPLRGKHPVEPEEPPVRQSKAAVPTQAASPQPALSQAVPAKRQNVAHVFDGQTRDKLSKGRLPIEGRVDLHGMTQDEAYALLLAFLRRAYDGGVRYVLIITGKGSSLRSEGVLRRAVPHWLSTAPFRGLVSGHDNAARHHGGGGALYVRLRRRQAEQ
ncbi:DNA mismatch repair protein MutS [Mesorhizobium sp. L-8-10]|uniref:Smr/MutS family protein n=1 Tax=unclassified Mesorhizobium TaxID=325217 RepID=UPI001928CD40|nr:MULTISPECIES: Smr/MutS family protein [unclassified Mesorhizobium]BCH21392.1 DNA mismatch repair protein MutS [Mesorhizobium sp. L-8-3]BCH29226.1 DNA mismatch repair protein MutS [Mesorhizobium sp. L-8-10]